MLKDTLSPIKISKSLFEQNHWNWAAPNQKALGAVYCATAQGKTFVEKMQSNARKLFHWPSLKSSWLFVISCH